METWLGRRWYCLECGLEKNDFKIIFQISQSWRTFRFSRYDEPYRSHITDHWAVGSLFPVLIRHTDQTIIFVVKVKMCSFPSTGVLRLHRNKIVYTDRVKKFDTICWTCSVICVAAETRYTLWHPPVRVQRAAGNPHIIQKRHKLLKRIIDMKCNGKGHPITGLEGPEGD